MSKRPVKACEYCEADHWDSEFVGRNQVSVELYPETNFIAVTAFLQSNDDEIQEVCFNIPMNYCPNCGRKLTN